MVKWPAREWLPCSCLQCSGGSRWPQICLRLKLRPSSRPRGLGCEVRKALCPSLSNNFLDTKSLNSEGGKGYNMFLNSADQTRMILLLVGCLLGQKWSSCNVARKGIS